MVKGRVFPSRLQDWSYRLIYSAIYFTSMEHRSTTNHRWLCLCVAGITVYTRTWCCHALQRGRGAHNDAQLLGVCTDSAQSVPETQYPSSRNTHQHHYHVMCAQCVHFQNDRYTVEVSFEVTRNCLLCCTSQKVWFARLVLSRKCLLIYIFYDIH